ncbi:hypothetical protein BPAE_0066g00380 [Botrytis paeoniae]|uniref:Uncharacterized protein n=1 Tax=Botrytis paeoniae TaxID=278948 RepID=A0A4Z1FT39_9HELO|nr:hypothetical protein BPAE_0066g00380 [Botrytis paeoniae]
MSNKQRIEINYEEANTDINASTIGNITSPLSFIPNALFSAFLNSPYDIILPVNQRTGLLDKSSSSYLNPHTGTARPSPFTSGIYPLRIKSKMPKPEIQSAHPKSIPDARISSIPTSSGQVCPKE